MKTGRERQAVTRLLLHISDFGTSPPTLWFSRWTEIYPYRRLAAVLAADVAGYSRLMGRDEERTLAGLKAAPLTRTGTSDIGNSPCIPVHQTPLLLGRTSLDCQNFPPRS